MEDLAPGAGWKPDWPLISQLFRKGRTAAAEWLVDYAGTVGRRATADLSAQFL